MPAYFLPYFRSKTHTPERWIYLNSKCFTVQQIYYGYPVDDKPIFATAARAVNFLQRHVYHIPGDGFSQNVDFIIMMTHLASVSLRVSANDDNIKSMPNRFVIKASFNWSGEWVRRETCYTSSHLICVQTLWVRKTLIESQLSGGDLQHRATTA